MHGKICGGSLVESNSLTCLRLLFNGFVWFSFLEIGLTVVGFFDVRMPFYSCDYFEEWFIDVV